MCRRKKFKEGVDPIGGGNMKKKLERKCWPMKETGFYTSRKLFLEITLKEGI